MTAAAAVEYVQQMADNLPHAIVKWSRDSLVGYRLIGREDILSEAVDYCAPYFAQHTTEGRKDRAEPHCLIAGIAPTALISWAMDDLAESVPVIERPRLRWSDHQVGEWRVLCRFRDDVLLDIFTLGPHFDATLIVDAFLPTHLGLVRLLRNRFTSSRLGAGSNLLHGGVVNIEEHGLLLLGEKEAGKTTLICELLDRGVAGFVSNDRTILSPDDTLFGLPVAVGVRAPTIARYRSLASSPASLFSHRLGLDAPGTRTYTVSDFVGCFGATITSEVPLGTAVHLVRSDERGVSLTPLKGDPAEQVIADCVMHGPDGSQPFWPSDNGLLPAPISKMYRLGVGRDELTGAVDALLSLIEQLKEFCCETNLLLQAGAKRISQTADAEQLASRRSFCRTAADSVGTKWSAGPK